MKKVTYKDYYLDKVPVFVYGNIDLVPVAFFHKKKEMILRVTPDLWALPGGGTATTDKLIDAAKKHNVKYKLDWTGIILGV